MSVCLPYFILKKTKNSNIKYIGNNIFIKINKKIKLCIRKIKPLKAKFNKVNNVSTNIKNAVKYTYSCIVNIVSKIKKYLIRYVSLIIVPLEENVSLRELDFINKYFRVPETDDSLSKKDCVLAASFFLFLSFLFMFKGDVDSVFGGMVLLCIAVLLQGFAFIKSGRPKRIKRKYKILQEAKEIIDRHFDALYTNFSRSRYQDEYGYWHNEGWNKELSYFFENVFFCELSEDGQKSVKDPFFKFKYEEFFSDYFYTKVQEEAEFISGGGLDEIETGEDFEDFIMDILKKKGFKVKKTPKTGDQGVDLIVRTGTDKIAIQCKFYSKAVGNKAVQEVAAGRVFYQCNKAVVVSNQTYTVSARQLAHSLGVELLNERTLLTYLGEISE